MAAKYVLSHQPAKDYHWNLLATNGRVIASSGALRDQARRRGPYRLGAEERCHHRH